MADEMDPANNQPAGYVPPKVWTWDAPSGGQFANINRPISGATSEKDLPVGKHPLQLYSMGTSNGVKVTIMLEELLAAGHQGAEYDAWLIRIGDGDQFTSGFVSVNPNSKIPAMMDHSTSPLTRLFESGGFDARRDIAGIVLNRWGHARVVQPPGFYFGTNGQPPAREVVARGYGRISIGHSELGGHQSATGAMAQGQRAALQALKIAG